MQQTHSRSRFHRSKTDSTMGAHQHYHRHAHQYQHSRHADTHARYNSEETIIPGPWQHMAQTYAWVSEQEFVKHEKQTKKTDKWILEHQIFVSELPNGVDAKGTAGATDSYKVEGKRSGQRQRHQYAYAWQAEGERWEEVLYASYQAEAEMWMKQQEEARRLAAERERAEEVRRIEMARQRQRHKEAEKRRMEEERAKYLVAVQEQERKERARADEAMLDGWRTYEERWKAISTLSEPLTFTSIPWPIISTPTSPAAITSAGIVLFLYSPTHSQSLSRKERIRHAQLRWHPDRFRKVLERVEEQDKAAVEEGVGIVARCLNDLMAREAVASRHQKSTM